MSGGSGTLLMITSDFPPISGGQSRFLYDLWSCLPADRVIILAPSVKGMEEVDDQLDCRVVRVNLPLGEGYFGKVVKAWLLLWSAWKLCRCFKVRGIHCGQVFSAGFAGYGCSFLTGILY